VAPRAEKRLSTLCRNRRARGTVLALNSEVKKGASGGNQFRQPAAMFQSFPRKDVFIAGGKRPG
jgi:hypothetical protein